MDRERWREEHLADAAGRLRNRRSTEQTGVVDLLTLDGLADAMGRSFDRAMSAGEAELITSNRALFTRLDPTQRLGSVARQRIDGAHDLELAGAIGSCEAVHFGDLPAPAGCGATGWTRTTQLRRGVPGVVVLPNGVRTRTLLTAGFVGGEGQGSYGLPILLEPARNPEDITSQALQQVELAVRGRELARRYAGQAGHVPLGSLPLLLRTLRPVAFDSQTNTVLGPPVALADLPEVVDRLRELTEQGIPFLAQAFVGPDGGFRMPDGWYLDLTPGAGRDAERPGTAAGIGGKVRSQAMAVLLGSSGYARDQQLVTRIPDAPGVAQITSGSVVAQGTCGPVLFRGVSHVSSEGRASFAITNLPNTEAGALRMAMAIEGAFGSLRHRALCRRRAAQFASRFDVQTNSMVSARRVGGLIVMAFRGTVVDRAGSVSR